MEWCWWKIEDNETPYEGIIRETLEETGIDLPSVTYKGNVVFKSKDESQGVKECMYSLLICQMGYIWTRQ